MLKRFDIRLILTTGAFLLITMFGLTTLIINQYQSALMRQREQQTLDAFQLSESRIDRLLQRSRRSASLLLQQPETGAYLYGHFEKESERVQALVQMLRMLSENLQQSSELSGIWFLREDGALVGATATWNFALDNFVPPLFQLDELAATTRWDQVTWLGGWWLEELTRHPPRDGNADAAHIPEDVMILGALRNRYRLDADQSMHTIYTLFSLDASALRECFETLGSDGEEVYLLDNNGLQLIGPDLNCLKTKPWFYDALLAGEHTQEQAEEIYQLVSHPLQSTGWMLCKKIPLDAYAHQVRSLRIMTWVLGTGIIFAALCLYSLWIIRFIRPVREISAALVRVRHGDLSVQLSHPSEVYEFELMRLEFNSMLQSIQQLLAQTQQMEHERIELELRNLQSQLNPHMIFNSMTAIRWMAMMSGAQKVSDMLAELAALIHPIFVEWRLSWPLRDEIEYLTHYTRLLSLRFGGLIQTTFRIDENLFSTELPCFTLQPLLENSAEHGLRDDQPLALIIEGTLQENGFVCLRVSDNGRGMTAGKRDALYAKMSSNDSRPDERTGHSGIGIVNIYRRLQMFSHAQCSLEIESSPNSGTVITICIPHTVQEDTDKKIAQS